MANQVVASYLPAVLRGALIALLLFLVASMVRPNAEQEKPSRGLAAAGPVIRGTPDDPHRDPREIHLRNVKQLTSGGTNAEAYFSYDGKRLIFQSTREPYKCDQIFVMNVDGSAVRLVSTGKGRTTCGYFYPDGGHILYSSTHVAGPECPPRPDYSRGYVWGVYSSFQIFYATDEGEIVKQLTSSPGYKAEATLSADGKKLVFASNRNAKQPREINIFIADWVP